MKNLCQIIVTVALISCSDEQPLECSKKIESVSISSNNPSYPPSVYSIIFRVSGQIDSITRVNLFSPVGGFDQIIDFEYDTNDQLTRSVIEGADIIVQYDTDGRLYKKGTFGIVGSTTYTYYWLDGQISKSIYSSKAYSSVPQEEVKSEEHYYYDSEDMLAEITYYNFANGVKSDSTKTILEYSSEPNILFEFRNELFPYFGEMVLMKNLPSKRIAEHGGVSEECMYDVSVQSSAIHLNGCGMEYTINTECGK